VNQFQTVESHAFAGLGCCSLRFNYNLTFDNMDQAFKVHSKVARQAQAQLFTEPAVKFLVAIHSTFEPRRQSLLAARDDAQRRFDSGIPLDFLSETESIRAEASWHCVPPGPGLEDRRVEITGPTDRKMVVNALNSGAKTFMADFEGMYQEKKLVIQVSCFSRF